MHLSVESDPRKLLSYETSIERELRPGPSCSKVGQRYPPDKSLFSG